MSAYPETQLNALVLQTYQIGESDILLDLLTEDGRISVSARGVRKLKSRLRYCLEPFSLITATIIDARSGPRLINALFIRNLYFDLDNTKAYNISPTDDVLSQKIIVRLLHLITRVVPPDETQLWVKEFLGLLENDVVKITNQYLFVTGYILQELGYLNFYELLAELSVHFNHYDNSLASLIDHEAVSVEKQLRLKQAITTALENSQL